MIECLVCELSLHHCSYLKSAVQSASRKKIKKGQNNRVYKEKEICARHKDGEMAERARWLDPKKKPEESEGEQPGQRKKRRFRPSTMVLQEI